MAMLRIPILLVIVAVYAQGKSHDGPMVAFMCNKPAMYYTNKGWQEDRETNCIKDPVKILDYCRQKFPELRVTNVVKASEPVIISNWCGFDKNKCHKHNEHEVTPFRCLVGAFQSDALLVPEHCLFDHKHGETKCVTYDEWNDTAKKACDERTMKLQSFAILQPCGVGQFNGVEFVCCPNKAENPTTSIPSTSKPSTSAPTTPLPKLVEIPQEKVKEQQDEEDEDFFAHYLQKSYDERYMNEHGYFMKAKADLQKHHHERVTKMMKEWAAARQRVQDMNDVDPKGAEKLNREITARFQKTYEALEEEGLAEKKQLQALHQQRVQSDLNDKKRHAMEHYMDALTTPDADAAYVLKALKHYIKAEQKDRLHTVNHYKHEADTDPKEALSLRPQTLNHLHIIDQRVQQAVDMLNRVPKIEKKVRSQTETYLKKFHEIDVEIDELLVDQVDSPVEVEEVKESKVVEQHAPVEVENKAENDENYEEYYDDDEYDMENEDDDLEDDYSNEGKDESDESLSSEEYDDDEEEREDESKLEPELDAAIEQGKVFPDGAQLRPTDFDEGGVDSADMDEHRMPQIVPAHNTYNKMEAQIEGKKVGDNGMKAGNSIYVSYTMGITVSAIAVFVILVAGIVLLRKKNAARAGANHGFVEIDQSTAAASPEERHVANMQMNGYENPTYKYFESNA